MPTLMEMNERLQEIKRKRFLEGYFWGLTLGIGVTMIIAGSFISG